MAVVYQDRFHCTLPDHKVVFTPRASKCKQYSHIVLDSHLAVFEKACIILQIYIYKVLEAQSSI